MGIVSGWHQVFGSRCREAAGEGARIRLGRDGQALSWALAGIVVLTSIGADPALAGRRMSVLPGGRPSVVARAKAPGVGRASILGGTQCPSCDPIAPFDPENFSHPLKIDNKYLPLEPRSQLVLEGRITASGEPLDHQVIFSVTELVKVIHGVPCVVVWDQDINEGSLAESELAFFAQDDEGNVWNLGEYPEEWDHGVFLGAENTWIAGLENATPGVHVRARPREGTAGYLEAMAPENDFWDCGMVFDKAKVKTCVPFNCYKDILVIREWAPLDGCERIQLKTYAKHVGVVQVGALDDPEGETLVLVDHPRLLGQALTDVNASALALDARGYIYNDKYAQTEPAQLGRKGHKEEDGDDDDRARVAQSEAALAPLHTFMSVGPNPVATSTSIAYGIVHAGPVDLAIFDIAGRRIRSLASGSTPAGIYRVSWDGRDGGGKAVGTGIYFARLRTETGVVGKTVVVAR
jgi:hypothetical protein